MAGTLFRPAFLDAAILLDPTTTSNSVPVGLTRIGSRTPTASIEAVSSTMSPTLFRTLNLLALSFSMGISTRLACATLLQLPDGASLSLRSHQSNVLYHLIYPFIVRYLLRKVQFSL